MPSHQCYKWVAVLGIVAVLLPVAAYADSGIERNGIEGTVRVSFYGLGDGYLGKRHAASHWGQTPDNWPEVVDLVHYGIATSDWSIPFGSTVCCRVIAFSEWAEDEYISLINNTACGIVVDRMAPWVYEELGPSLDLWSALFQRLAGPDWQRIGILYAKCWMYRNFTSVEYN